MHSPIPAFTQTLSAMAKVLTKAEAHADARKIEHSAFLTARLYPDMFHFTKQVQLTCDFAARAAARLAGADVPSFPDTETTFAELQTRIDKALAYIASFKPDRFADADTRSIILKMRGVDVTLSGTDYLTLYSLPTSIFMPPPPITSCAMAGWSLAKATSWGCSPRRPQGALKSGWHANLPARP